MKFSNKIKSVPVVLAIVGIAATSWAVQYTIGHKTNIATRPKVTSHNDSVSIPHYDTVMLKKFKAISESLNIKDKACTYSGVINIVNKADTTQTVKNVRFLFCKRDQNCYYRMGNTETLNNNGIYLYVDHDHKKVIVGPQKSLSMPDIAGSANLKDNLTGENYALTCKSSGEKQTLTLLNEKHITCKEYAITYDTVTRKVNRIFARMSNFNEPLNKAKERLVDVLFNDWQYQANVNNYLDPKTVLAQYGNEIKLVGIYKTYELIRIQ